MLPPLADNNGNCWSSDLLDTIRLLLAGTNSDSELALGRTQRPSCLTLVVPDFLVSPVAAKLPIHFYWLRMIIRSWNTCTKSGGPHTLSNPFMSKNFRADLKLADGQLCVRVTRELFVPTCYGSH